MNKKGSTVFFFLMIGITFFVLGLALTPGLRNVTNEAMESPELNCSDSSISDQNKTVCDSIDILPFLYFGTLFGLAGILIGNSFL